MQPTVRDLLRSAGLTAFRHLPLPVRRLGVRVAMPSFTVGAVVVWRREGQVLLVRQRHTGAWALPGGLLERGETPAAAAARELGEELGVALQPERLGAPTVFVDAERRRVDVIFDVRLDDREPRVGDTPEVVDIGWFAPDRAPDITGPTAQILASVGLPVAPR